MRKQLGLNQCKCLKKRKQSYIIKLPDESYRSQENKDKPKKQVTFIDDNAPNQDVRQDMELANSIKSLTQKE